VKTLRAALEQAILFRWSRRGRGWQIVRRAHPLIRLSVFPIRWQVYFQRHQVKSGVSESLIRERGILGGKKL